jgi:hypothetical protein
MVAPAVGKRQQDYTVGLSKASSAIDEVRLLLQTWIPGEDDQALLKRVRESGLLGRQTAQRTYDLVFRVFRYRLMQPSDLPARRLKRIVEQDGDPQTFKQLLFLYTARADALLYDFTVERYWPAYNGGELILRPQDVQDFLKEAAEDGRLARTWSATTQVKISRSVIGALRDFGFLYEDRRGYREIVEFHPADFTVAYLAYDLHLAGLTDSATVEHPDWGLFGLTHERVLNRLDGLDERAGLIVQRAGSVVRVTWLRTTMEEVIDAYSG